MNQPNLSPVPEKDKWILTDDYPNKKYGTLVPAFFLTDGASIPKVARLFLYDPFHPKVIGPAVNHDWGYWNHQYDRAYTDQIFYQGLIDNKVPVAKAKLMYHTVRRFGGAYWDNDADDFIALTILHFFAKSSPRFEEYHFPIGVL